VSAASHPKPLQQRLAAQIREDGPLSVASFMAQALSDTQAGYYTTRDPLGTKGDFTTAPEISQMFGELIGLWCADYVLAELRTAERLHLIELGPGRGTLMNDALRALSSVPGLSQRLCVSLVEISPALREKQKETLLRWRQTMPIDWHGDLDGALRASDAPILLIANEFFDALPIRQFVRTKTGWQERMIGLDETGGLAFKLAGAPVALADLPQAKAKASEDAVIELCPAGEALAGTIGAALAERGGGGLIIDYGYARSAPGDTLQAVRAHEYHPVLKAPGEADLTAHVDFEALARAAESAGAIAWSPLDQGPFLQALGIDQRTERLAAANAGHAEQVQKARDRLCSEDEMGSLFKAVALTGGKAPPAAFAERYRFQKVSR